MMVAPSKLVTSVSRPSESCTYAREREPSSQSRSGSCPVTPSDYRRSRGSGLGQGSRARDTRSRMPHVANKVVEAVEPDVGNGRRQLPSQRHHPVLPPRLSGPPFEHYVERTVIPNHDVRSRREVFGQLDSLRLAFRDPASHLRRSSVSRHLSTEVEPSSNGDTSISPSRGELCLSHEDLVESRHGTRKKVTALLKASQFLTTWAPVPSSAMRPACCASARVPGNLIPTTPVDSAIAGFACANQRALLAAISCALARSVP